MDKRILFFFFFLTFFLLREIFLLLREAGDYMKLRESPAENGRVGISAYRVIKNVYFNHPVCM